MKRVTIADKRRIFSDFFKIDEAIVSHERFDGRMSVPRRLLCFERGDSVAVIIFHREKRTCILANQFRFPAFEKGPGWILECVAGMLKAGEDPAEAIRRETTEEIGYAIARLELISTFYVSPGGSSERIILYYAEVTGAPQGGGGLEDEGEDIQMVEITLAELRRMVTEGQLHDAKTLIGAQWLLAQKGA